MQSASVLPQQSAQHIPLAIFILLNAVVSSVVGSKVSHPITTHSAIPVTTDSLTS